MFWAEAVATEVRSIVTVMPVTRMSLTPRLERLGRRINKARLPRRARRGPPGAQSLNAFGGGRKYDQRVPGERPLANGESARLLTQPLSVRLGQSVIVENQPGGARLGSRRNRVGR